MGILAYIRLYYIGELKKKSLQRDVFAVIRIMYYVHVCMNFLCVRINK
jgi:hypothetical protein